MGVSKVVLGEETLVDLTSDSVNEENLLEGATAHGADGEPVKGTVEIKPKTLTTTKAGEQIHLVDSTDNKVVEFSLYGKARQQTTSGKNLLKNTATTRTVNGVTFTVNEDKSISIKGTATGNTNLIIESSNDLIKRLPKSGTIILSGGFTGGSYSTYYFRTQLQKDGNKESFNFYGDPVTISYNKLEEGENCNTYIFVNSGVTVDIIIYPMIRLASIEDDTYEPYTGGIASPNPDYPQYIEVSGESYNLLENTAESQTINGVTFTVNADKSVTANGTASANVSLILVESVKLKAGTYILSGCPAGGTENTYKIDTINNETNKYPMIDVGSGKEYTFSSDVDLKVRIRIISGTTANELTFYPMIRKASVKNDRYMPYGKGSVEVKSVGKNLLKNVATTKTVEGVTFTINNKDGSINANGTSASTSVSKLDIGTIELKAGVTYIISGCTGGADNKYRFSLLENNNLFVFVYGEEVVVTPETDCTINVRLDVFKDCTIDNIIFYPMIRLASDTDNTYEPYKETLSTIPTPSGLAGIKVDNGGNYTDSNGQQWICDELVKYADGSGEYVKRIEKVIFDGSEDEPWSLNETNNNTVRCVCGSNSKFNIKGNSNAISDKLTFIGKTVNNNYNESIGILDYCCFNIRDSLIGFTFRLPSTITSVDGIREYLSANNITVYYCLAEPIHTPLTAEQIAEIEKVSTFSPVTNISNDFDCGMNVEYVLEKVITTQAPIPVIQSIEVEELKSGDTTLTLFGKIKKWLTSIKPHAFLNPVNNLLATVSGSALDATQGKVLDDKISAVNESLGEVNNDLTTLRDKLDMIINNFDNGLEMFDYTSSGGVNYKYEPILPRSSVTISLQRKSTYGYVNVLWSDIKHTFSKYIDLTAIGSPTTLPNTTNLQECVIENPNRCKYLYIAEAYGSNGKADISLVR